MKVAISLSASDAVYEADMAVEGQPVELELGEFEFELITALYGWLSIGADREHTIAVIDNDGYWVRTSTTKGPNGHTIEKADSTGGRYSDICIRPVTETSS